MVRSRNIVLTLHDLAVAYLGTARNTNWNTANKNWNTSGASVRVCVLFPACICFKNAKAWSVKIRTRYDGRHVTLSTMPEANRRTNRQTGGQKKNNKQTGKRKYRHKIQKQYWKPTFVPFETQFLNSHVYMSAETCKPTTGSQTERWGRVGWKKGVDKPVKDSLWRVGWRPCYIASPQKSTCQSCRDRQCPWRCEVMAGKCWLTMMVSASWRQGMVSVW